MYSSSPVDHQNQDPAVSPGDPDCPTWAVFQNQPHKGLGHYHLVQSGNVGVDELAMVMDFPRKVRIVLFGRLENNLEGGSISKHPPRKNRPGGEHALEPFVSL